ncbi:MAG: TonB-dependent receptor [Gammaproteobacteria bacterium]|nr:TonB-dependent receptor [Gammaproteobacteria bacterium]
MRNTTGAILITILATGLLPCLPVNAAEGDVNADRTELDDVVVTATRHAITQDRLPANAIVIDRATIERNVGADLADILRQHAGLDVARNGGPGAATSLFIRGTESNHVLLLVDGIEMNPGSIGGPALQNIPLDSIERIEIIKGPRSSLYGSEAIGGVINIVTRRGDRLAASATLGSFDTEQLDGSYHGSQGNWQYGLDLGSERSDGFAPRADSAEERGYERDHGNGYVRWQNERAMLELRHWEAEGISEYLGFFLEPLSQEYRNEMSSIEARLAGDDSWSARLLLGRGVDEIRQRDPNFLGEFDFVRTVRDTIDWQHDFFLSDDHRLTAGVYLEGSEVDSLSFGEGYSESTDVTAYYLQDAVGFGDNSMISSVRYSDFDAIGSETTWNIGWNHRFSEAQRLFIAAGTGFRLADATDRFGFGGNPDLEPESSENIEIGYSADMAAHRFEATVFRNDIDELIAYVDPDGFAGPATGSNVNIDRARIEGIELAYRWHNLAWRFDTEIIIQDPEDLTTESQLARRARRSISASLVREFGAFSLGLAGVASSERPDSPFSTAMLPGYGVVDLTAGWDIDPNWSLGLRVQNVGDRDYQTAEGYNSEEQSFYLTLRFQQ